MMSKSVSLFGQARASASRRREQQDGGEASGMSSVSLGAGYLFKKPSAT